MKRSQREQPMPQQPEKQRRRVRRKRQRGALLCSGTVIRILSIAVLAAVFLFLLLKKPL